MALRIEINCYCDYKCNCKPIPETKVTKQEIAYNLMRCNPALARYFSNTLSTTETLIDRKQIKKDSPKSYRSIVDEKNMNILLSDRYPAPVIEVPQQKKDVFQIKIDNFMNTYAQTSPRNFPEDKKPKQKPKKDPTEQEIRDYYRELKQTSRYLPNTAFKKYFNRPIFENYGRQNTKGTNDGIIYGNYLKTHNINPHLGENRPHDEQTFYHALISASPQKLLGPKGANIVEQQKGKNLSLTKSRQYESFEKPIKKNGNNTDAIIMDNIHQHTKLNTLTQKKLSPKSRHSPKAVKIIQSDYGPIRPKKQTKSPKARQIKSPQSITSHYVDKVQHIQPVKPAASKLEIDNNQVSPRNNLKAQKSQINKLSQIKPHQNQQPTKNIKIEEDSMQKTQDKCPVIQIQQNDFQNFLSKNCNLKKSPRNISKAVQKSSSKKTIQKLEFGPGSPKSCVCGSGSQRGQGNCHCLLTKVKRQLKQLAQKDADLNNRLIASARKSTLYKNFSLNSGQNAKLNPHNYTPCCGQIYQK